MYSKSKGFERLIIRHTERFLANFYIILKESIQNAGLIYVKVIKPWFLSDSGLAAESGRTETSNTRKITGSFRRLNRTDPQHVPKTVNNYQSNKLNFKLTGNHFSVLNNCKLLLTFCSAAEPLCI